MSTPKMTSKLRLVHETVQRTGALGARLADVYAALRATGLTMKAVHQRLIRLRDMHLVEQTEPRGPYFALEAPDSDKARALLERCLEAVADCPGGLSDDVLAEGLELTPAEVRRALQPALLDGRVVRLRMPTAHGGGKGFAVGSQDTAPAPVVVQDARSTDDATGAFDLIDNTRLAVAWDGARIVLPASVTRGLFLYLDALGGLQIVQRLGMPVQAGSTAGDAS